MYKRQVSESMALHRSKAPYLKEKIPKQLVDSIQLSTMVTTYSLHFLQLTQIQFRKP
jgi:hypothetical protein